VAYPVEAPDDLYGLPLDEFTPARDALAKELKAAGRKDEAADVKARRKPSLAAWALNRAARDHPEAVEAVRAAGGELRRAQSEAMSGDASGLRDAGRALSDEIERYAGLAAEALEAAGRPVSAAQQEKMNATLRTAAVDDAAGDALARGVLVDELESTGFSLLGGMSGDLSTVTAPAPAHRPERKAKASKEQMEAVEAARRELRRCDAAAEEAATRARRRAERAEAAVQRAAEAQRQADEARAAAEEAAGEAEAARRRAAEAADALAAAEAAIPS
jgi:hypothetical protein